MEAHKNEINEIPLKDNLFTKLKSIHDYNVNKKDISISNDNKQENDNIYIKYLKNNNIIFQNQGDINNKNLKLLFEEIDKDLKIGNNIVFPFLDVCQNLIEAYIESDLDDTVGRESISQRESLQKSESTPKTESTQRPKSKSKYLMIFEKLKNNCFINKETIYPMYHYFSNLYDIVTNTDVSKELEGEDILLKKCDKVTKLFEIFYETKKEGKINNESSFCFIGGNIKIIFDQEIKISEVKEISIGLNIMNFNYIKMLNDNLNLIKINENERKYKEIKSFDNIDKIKRIKIKINKDKKKNNKKENLFLSMKVKNNIKEILLLEEYYGQISSIDISIVKKDNKIKYQFFPISIRNENTVYYKQKIIKKNDKFKEIIPKIIINDINLVNINYIKYNDKIFNAFEYFGGIIQFLPFYTIIKKLYQIKANIESEITNNDSLSLSDINMNKSSVIKYEYVEKETLNDFIIFILIKILETVKNEEIIQNNLYFVYSLLLDLDIDVKDDLNNYITNHKFFKYLETPLMIYYNQKNFYFSNIKEEMKLLLDSIKSENIFKKPKKTINQLYNEYMKQLFSFNNYWSKRNLFYPKRYNNSSNKGEKEIKYKQINYYTKNFQLPFFYPILEYKNYYPHFKSYKGDFFKESNRNVLEYDFKLDLNEKTEKIMNSLISKEEKKETTDNNTESCCLVKNTHHIFGNIRLTNSQNDKNKFNIIFEPIKKNEENENKEMKCNKKNDPNKKLENKNEKKINIDQYITPNPQETQFGKNISSPKLCYGAVFPCPEREYIKNVIIKSKNIIFILIREYYHRVSGIEIFTINKSYYFNFQKPFDINNVKTNKILSGIINNHYFKEIKMKNRQIIIGYFNKKYRSYLYPLFEDEIDVWNNKNNYLCNYDKIILINLLSNRSFRDIYQYPIFPMLYDLLGLKRKMGEHIGTLSINEEARKKRDIIFKNFMASEEDQSDYSTDEEIYLFNIHYSNPAFTFNFLLRVIPYSFLAIEFQGDNFDDPNRLFHSIEGALNSTLTIKSDLREMIPELYYLIELFYNKNNISFGVLYDGREIDNVLIKENEKIESEIKRKENYAQFLNQMRYNLDNETEINEWIDLIFGNMQRFYKPNEKYQYKYYSKCSEVNLKDDQSILEDDISMDKVNFGLLPYQLFKVEFPKKYVDDDVFLKEQKTKELIKKLNSELFKDEHIKIKSPNHTFFCKGRILIDENYIRIINQNEKINKTEYYFDTINNINIKGNTSKINQIFYNKIFGNLDMDDKDVINNKNRDNMNLVNYYFFGNILGNVYIYSLKELKKNENKDDSKKENKKMIYNAILNKKYIEGKYQLELVFINKLNHHSKEIKYIDFNARLNILLSYSLDEFINIYIFPKFKLINAIDTNSFREENDKNYFEEVVLISYPFPSIICHNREYIYYISINGELIKYDKLSKGDKIKFSIDKNLGFAKDEVEIYDSKEQFKTKFNFFCEEKQSFDYRKNEDYLLEN